ncbi:MAG: arsenate reductase ArsC [Firmicutes bacterium]|nr:arsenate reductase ArsC [Bacillota bacterium]
MKKYKVAFVCVHNSLRSQMAEALTKHLASDVFIAYSGGTQKVSRINQDAVRVMKKLYQIDMESSQTSKTISDLPFVDIVITMGCDVICPNLPCHYKEDWNLEDPTGKEDKLFIQTAQTIHLRILDLKDRILNKQIIFEE